TRWCCPTVPGSRPWKKKTRNAVTPEPPCFGRHKAAEQPQKAQKGTTRKRRQKREVPLPSGAFLLLFLFVPFWAFCGSCFLLPAAAARRQRRPLRRQSLEQLVVLSGAAVPRPVLPHPVAHHLP